MSATITVTVTGPAGGLTAEIDERVIAEWIEECLNSARNLFIRSMSTSRGGRLYRRGRRSHVASAPGQYPATDTGRLANSVNYEVSGREGVIDTNVFYAGFLTTGTSKMAKRKMLAEALDEFMRAAPPLPPGIIRLGASA